ncbi:MAG: translation elongation factor Ts [Myxococcota bacterium]|jgi:elongation factor Ts
MAEISAAMVKELREKTGAGMMDCKKALAESAGDFAKAEEWLRKKGVASAAKKGSRVAAEGLIGLKVSDDGKLGALVEVNAETDFVARNAEFVKLTTDLVAHIAQHNPADLDTLLAQSFNGKTVKDAVTEKIATIGENITVRRFVRFQVESNGVVGSYLHSNSRVGALVEVLGSTGDEAKALANELAMQLTAMRPAYVSREQVPADVIEREKTLYKDELQNTWRFTIKDGPARTGILRSEDAEKVMLEISGKLEKVPLSQIVKREQIKKPENMWDKIIGGKLEKFFEENCLVDQAWVKDDKLKIKDVVAEAAKKAGTSLTVGRASRLEVGEGIEKKKDDLAAEVAKTLGQA